MDYNLVECEKDLRSSEQIFKRWETDRYKISRTITASEKDKNNLNNVWEGIIPQDPNCKCKIKNPYIKSETCIACLTISRLFVNGESISEVPFSIKLGKYAGKKFIIKKFTKSNSKSYKLTDKPINLGQKILKEFDEIQKCETNFPSQINDVLFFKNKGIYIENYALISCFLEKELKKVNFPLSPTFRWIFECANDINIVEEIYDIEKLDDLYKSKKKTNISKGIIVQLFSILHYLNNYAFTHGNPNVEHLKFEKKTAKYTYDGIDINFPFSLTINPSSSSSISSINDDENIIRIYNPGNLNEKNISFSTLPKIEIQPFVNYKKKEDCGCEIPSTNTNEYTKNRTICYKIGKNPTSFLGYVKNLGIPLFYSSFDIYSFFVSLMCNDNFYNDVLKNTELLNLWKNLWNPKEYNDIMEDFENLRHNKISIPHFLGQYFLRCDALEITWDGVKKMME
uniref:Uncharacterized protein n=1 Tax=viral metagenome TaxID=1070528 RepID=A0A6C0AFB4_9ZZZZ